MICCPSTTGSDGPVDVAIGRAVSLFVLSLFRKPVVFLSHLKQMQLHFAVQNLIGQATASLGLLAIVSRLGLHGRGDALTIVVFRRVAGAAR